jgi:hypothetical protein
MKKTLLYFSLFIGLSSFIALAAISIYTEKQKDQLIDYLISYYQPFEAVAYDGDKTIYSPEIQPLHLFNLLYANIYAQKPDDYQDGWAAGYYTSKIYQENFRDIVAKNPQLIYEAWNLYGDDIIMGLNSKLGYYASNKTDYSYKFQAMPFTTKAFWQAQKVHIQRYQNLITKLLSLDDKRLNFFISSAEMYDDAKCYDLNVWLKENKLNSYTTIESPYLQIPGASNGYSYPGDLLLLSNRVKKITPEWTPRRFLTEVNKFAQTIVLSIDKNVK